MDLWLVNHYFKKLRRSPKLSGPQLYLSIFIALFVFGYLALLGNIVDDYISVYIEDPSQRVVAVMLGLFFTDLFFRLLFSAQSFASYSYFTLPISIKSYSVQTLILSNFNIFNLVAGLFLLFYWPNVQLDSALSSRYLIFIGLLILSNNYLVLIFKRYKVVLITTLVLLATSLLFYQLDLIRHFETYLAQGIYFELGYALLVMLAAYTSVHSFYHKEAYEVKKSFFENVKLNIKLQEPLLWQEVLLILRNKRPRGVILSYFLVPIYLAYAMRDSLVGDNAIAAVIFFLLFYTISGLAIQYGYLGLSWESRHFDILMIRSNIRQMVLAKIKLLTAFNLIATGVALILAIIDLSFVPKVLAITLFQLSIGTYLILYLMSYNNKGIDVNRSSFFNYQGVSAVQMFGPLIIIAIPTILYFILELLIGELPSYMLIGGMGMVGIIFKEKLIKNIEVKWASKRYQLIHNYRKS